MTHSDQTPSASPAVDAAREALALIRTEPATAAFYAENAALMARRQGYIHGDGERYDATALTHNISRFGEALTIAIRALDTVVAGGDGSATGATNLAPRPREREASEGSDLGEATELIDEARRLEKDYGDSWGMGAVVHGAAGSLGQSRSSASWKETTKDADERLRAHTIAPALAAAAEPEPSLVRSADRVSTRIEVEDGTRWPRPALESDDEYGVAHRLRYGTPTKSDLLAAASIIDAYGYLVAESTREKRDMVCRSIRKHL